LVGAASASAVYALQQTISFHSLVMADKVIDSFNFLNGSIHGNITINKNDNASQAAKRRRIVIDSDSKE